MGLKVMIGFLRGEVFFKEGNCIVLDVKGVGYKVLAASDVLSKAIKGTSLELFIYTHVREDNISLFGFLEALDLKLFENLISVSGIGPKTAMNIFSVGTRAEITNAVVQGNVDFFTSVPRLGRKNAQKIIIELKNKFGGIKDLDLSGEDMSGSEEVVAALKGFGFTSSEIHDAIRNVKKNPSASRRYPEGHSGQVTETIKLALKYLGK